MYGLSCCENAYSHCHVYPCSSSYVDACSSSCVDPCSSFCVDARSSSCADAFLVLMWMPVVFLM